MRRLCVLAVLSTTLAGADPAERTVLTGKVVDPAGKLVAGARVTATMDFYDPDNKAVAERFPASGFVLAADGTFVVREGAVRPGVKTLKYRTTASAEGYSSSDEVVSVPIGKPGYRPAIVKLRPAVEHQVLVIDDFTKAPIAGATVTHDCTTLQQQNPTGADGTLHLRGCDDRNRNPIMVNAAGYRFNGVNPDYTRASDTITMAKLRPLRLHVVDIATGAAVARCEIVIEGVKRTTDARGSVDHLAPYGTISAAPSCANYGANLDAAPGVVFGPADAQAVHELRLRHNFSVDGKVVDAKARPIAGARIEVRPVNEISTARPMALATATTDATGAFHIGTFSADTFLIYVAGPTWTSDAQTIVWKTQKSAITLVAKPQ